MTNEKRIEELEQALAKAQNEVKKLKKNLSKLNDEFYFVPGEDYFTIGHSFGGFAIDKIRYQNNEFFHNMKKNFRLFKSYEEAEMALNRINFLLKLSYYKSIYEPNNIISEADFGVGRSKYSIIYSIEDKKYIVQTTLYSYDETSVYFKSKKVAQHICSILNEEVE